MIRLLLGFFGLFIAGMMVIYELGYRVVETPSVPPGIWQVTGLKGALRRGQFVWVCPPDTGVFKLARERKYIPGGLCPGSYMPLIKPIVAISGDIVALSKTGVGVNNRLIINSAPLLKDDQGAPMPVYQAGTYKVAPGFIWLVSHYHPKSFDSRYFGPVRMSQIQGIARPIWVWQQ